MAGPHTLAETERQVADRLGDLTLDFEAMAVVSNLFRAANAVRNHLERSVLAPADLEASAAAGCSGESAASPAAKSTMGQQHRPYLL